MDILYRTKDLSEASLLYAKHKRLVKLNNDNGRIWFLFDDRAGCEGLSEAYWRKELDVNAREFVDAMRAMKDIVFSHKREEATLTR